MYTIFHGCLSRNKNDCSNPEAISPNTECDRILRELYPYELGPGVFLDVGAGEPVFINNSYHFRKNGWQVISIEANPIYCKLFRDENFEIIECAVADYEASNREFDIYHWSGHMLSNSSLRPNSLKDLENIKTIKVEVKTINSLLQQHYPNINKIHILSVDIEGGEIAALKGFDIKKYEPDVCCIEDWHTYYGAGAAKGINSGRIEYMGAAKGINPELIEYMETAGYECVRQNCCDTYWKRKD